MLATELGLTRDRQRQTVSATAVVSMVCRVVASGGGPCRVLASGRLLLYLGPGCCASGHFGQTPRAEVVLGWLGLCGLGGAETDDDEEEEVEEEEEEDDDEEGGWLGCLAGGGTTPIFLSSQYSL